MSTLQTALALFMIIAQVNSLKNGYVKGEIKDRFCSKRTGLVKLPWDCTGYLHCYTLGSQTSGVWINCPNNLQFDSYSNNCIRESPECRNMTSTAEQYCPLYPTLRFPHPESCAMFYDCAQRKELSAFSLKKYENECPFPMMFDPEISSCRLDPANDIQCFNRPQTKCAYKTECVMSSPECEGVGDGLAPAPGTVFTSDYIQCQGGLLINRLKCKLVEEVFDPIKLTCVSHYHISINDYCVKNPRAKFADPMNCARYYDCSSRYHHFGLLPYQSECAYTYLFDQSSGDCQLFDALKVPCGAKFEPKAPCEYKIGRCLGREYCMACSASCVGQKDGEIPYPGIPRTRFHLFCRGERTMEIQECPKGQIFLASTNDCAPDIEETTTKKPTTTTTTTTTTTKPTTSTTSTTTTTTTTKPSTPSKETTPFNFFILLDMLKNLTDFVNDMEKRMFVKPKKPFDCVSPPVVMNGNLAISFEDDQAIATYSCDSGFAMCGKNRRSVCKGDNSWDNTSLPECVIDTWEDLPDESEVYLSCLPEIGKTIVIKGRYKSSVFRFQLTSADRSTTLLTLVTKPWEGVVEYGQKPSGKLQSSFLSESLLGQLTWYIELKKDSFDISVNYEHVASVPHSFNLDELKYVKIGPNFQTDLVSVGRYPMQESPTVKVPLDENLALGKRTTASSNYVTNEKPVNTNRVNDGNTNVYWSSDSCWSVTYGDDTPWWQVNLGQNYYISNLVIASRACTDSCGDRLHDFKINVYRQDPYFHPEAEAEVCATYNGVFPAGEIRRVNCTSEVIGRYVRIVGFGNRSRNDLLTLCEVEVFGGEVKEKGWTPFSCPNPPLVPRASVQVSYGEEEASAKYTCIGTDLMCIGHDVITCNEEEGWSEDPGTCIQTDLDAGIGGRLDDFPICPLDLGAGIELWVTPTGDTGKILLLSDSGPVFSIALSMGDMRNPISLSHVTAGKWVPSIYPTYNPFMRDREAHIVISFLSDHLLIEVDDDVLFKYPHDEVDVHKAIFLKSSPGLDIRKAQIHNSKIFDVTRETDESNLALRANVEVSSTYGNPEYVAVDGNPIDAPDKGFCWHAQIGDKDQWFQIDLGKYFFIRDILIDNSDQCAGCEISNVALFKPTFGSDGFDARSSPAHAVNNELATDAGNCFISSVRDSQPWWMVDLGKVYEIAIVALQRQKDSNPAQLSDIEILTYMTNPELDIGATPTICAKRDDALGDFDSISCDNPVKGRYVRVQRQAAHDFGIITLCEVQVFALVTVENRLHNITVDVFVDNPLTDNSAEAKPCVHNEEDVPVDEPQTLSCHGDVWGRFVRIKADSVFGQNDLMTLCEVDVYGDRSVKKDWSPLDCPNPPLMDDTILTLSYTSTEAFAAYSCAEDFSDCGGQDTITCSSNDGWKGQAVPCKRMSFSSSDDGGLQWLSGFCPLKLGNAIDMYIAPRAQTSSIKMMSVEDGEMVMMIVFELTETSEMQLLTGPITPSTVPLVVPDLPLKMNEDVKLTLTFISDEIDISIDGTSIYSFPIEDMAFNEIDNIIFHETVTREANIIQVQDEKLFKKKFMSNLALRHPTSASSTGQGNHEWVVDGRLIEMAMEKSCWASKAGDEDPWWKVDLQKYYFITHIELTSRDNCNGQCDLDVLRDFIVEVFYEDPQPEDKGTVCVKYHGVFPHSSRKTLTCTEPVYGRYLRVRAPARLTSSDLLTLCEVQVFGGKIMLADWTPFNCPNPPLISDASAQLTYTSDRATVLYTCFDKFTMCSGSDVIHCKNEEGWVDPPGHCLKTTLDFVGNGPNEFPTCKPKLGQGIEIWVVPRESGGELQLNNFEAMNSVLQIKLDLDFLGVYLTDSYDGKSVGKINPPFNPFALDKESHVVIIFISTGLLILVDDSVLYKFVGHGAPPMIDYVFSTPSLQLKKAMLVPRYMEGIYRDPIIRNLALNKNVYSNPESGDQNANLTTDGNPSQSGMLCWYSSPADTKPWLMIDLVEFFFVREVKLYNRDDCPGCVGSLRDFAIDILPVTSQDDLAQRCAYYSGVFPPGGVHTVLCEEDVWGRYVSFIFPAGGSEVFTLCEVEVYGDEVTNHIGTATV